MGYSTGDYYKAAYPVPPFASNDSRVVLDYGVGSANPWSLDGVTLNAQYGFAANGAGIQFDSALGMNCGPAGDIRSATQLPNAPTSEGTLYFELERAGAAEANVGGGGTNFYDNNRAFGAGGYLFRCGAFGTNFASLNVGATSGDTQTLQAAVHFAGTTQNNLGICSHFNSHAPSRYVDPRFATVMITWRGGTFYFYQDGQFVTSTQAVDGAPPTAALFSAMTLGSNNGAGGSYWKYWIRRFQVTNALTQIPLAGPQIAVLGDSFVLGGINGAGPVAPDNPTVAAVNAVQNFNWLSTRLAGGNTGYSSNSGATPWMMSISSAVATRLGFLPRLYVCGHSGHGWSQALAPFAQGYGDAIIQASPEILICLGSVNDVNLATDASATLGADTKAKLDYITAGKSGGAAWAAGVTQYPVRLRQILFFEGFSWEGTGGAIDPLYIPQRRRNWASQYAALNGQKSNGVPIAAIPVCDVGTPGVDAWNTDPIFRTFFGDTNNPNNTSSSNNGHPCATGEARIGDIIAPYVLGALGASPY